MPRLAALVVLGCVAAARGGVMNPCNETACSDSLCQWNTEAGQCEFKDKLGRECAKTDTSSEECPDFCTLTYEGTYRYCKAGPSPSCFELPESLCEDPHCKWRPDAGGSSGFCFNYSAIRTLCDDPGCTDSRCELNDGTCEFKIGQAMNPCNETACSDDRCQWNTEAGQCEFKSEQARECAKTTITTSQKCPGYCGLTYEGAYRYCGASIVRSCYGLPESLCEDYHCKWRLGDNGSRGYCQYDTTVRTPCDDAECTNSRCQLNNGTCEFKTKIGRMCAIRLDPSYLNCPEYCRVVSNMKYNYCQAKPSPSCRDLPRELCGEPQRCMWNGHQCKDQVSTPCDDAGCANSQCRMNNGTCEFKTKIGRMCAMRSEPSYLNCPDYCSFVQNETYNYCKAKSSPLCFYLPRELCGDPYRCKWIGGSCQDQWRTPCDEVGCTDSRCQMNNGTCEFKTKAGRECAKVLYGSCPLFCTRVTHGEYRYCEDGSDNSCYFYPKYLCEEMEDCEWSYGSCSTKFDSHLSTGVIVAIVLSSLCVPAMCLAVVVCLLCVRQRTAKQVVTNHPVQMDAVVPQSNYSSMGPEGTVPVCGIPVNGYPPDAPPVSCCHPAQAVAVPVENAHPEGPSPSAC